MLLHEIIHTWQMEFYREDSPSEAVRKFISDANISAYMFFDYHEKFIRGEIGEKERDDMELFAVERLHGHGLTLDRDQCYSLELERDAFLKVGISYGETGHSFYFSDFTILENLMEKFEQSERCAWAYAIKIVRFLRKKGIDIEPELKTFDDFKSVYESALQSYQLYGEAHIVFPERPWKFMKREVVNCS